MPHQLYIAEKADAGKALAAYLSKTTGIPARPFKTHVIVGGDVVSWLRGHVLELLEPDEYDEAYADRNNFAILPFIPPQFKQKPVKHTSHLVSNIRDLLKDASNVVHFGDPDREGQLIVDELLQFLGNRKPVSRLWAAALDDTTLAKALSNLRDNREFIGQLESARARRDADFLYGINMSRAVTIAARKRGARAHIPIGRVLLPTLALVVLRELSIRSFVSVDYYEPWIDVSSTPGFRAKWVIPENDTRVNAEKLLVDKKIATGIVDAARVSKIAEVIGYDTTPGSLAAPLPFSLSALQAHCDNLFGLAPDETLAIAQSLYLRKITSYPRTSSDYLPESQHGEAAAILTSLAKSPLPTQFATALRGAKVSLKSKAWNDVEQAKHSHHAIVPVHLDNPGVLADLNPDEKKVYAEIVRRYVLQFWPAAQFLTTMITLRSGGESYVANGRKYTDEGWRKAFATANADEEDAEDVSVTLLPVLQVGQQVSLADVGMNTKVTKPKKRFTGGSLLMAMREVHQFVVDPNIRSRLKASAGIGTEATRAETIKGLVDNGMLEKKGKEFVPSERAMMIVQALPTTMTAPDMTAMWESFMDTIMAGKASYAAFMERQVMWLRDLVRESEAFFANITFPKEASGVDIEETDHKCNACQSPLRRINGKHGWFFGCSNMECKKVFQDKDGLPVEKVERPKEPDSGVDCPVCKKHTLRRRERADKTGFWWSCNGWKPENKGCNASFKDNDGMPDFTPKAAPTGPACPQCKKGALFRVARKAPAEGHFWSCNRWRDGCKCTFNDLDGAPDLEGKTKKTGTGTSSGSGAGTGKTSGSSSSGTGKGSSTGAGAPKSGSPKPTPPGAATPSMGNRFMAAVTGRGGYQGGKR